MTKNELAINNWVRHRDQGEKPYRITSIIIDGEKYLYTAEGLQPEDTYIDVRAAAFEPIAITEVILKSCGYVQMVDINNPDIIRSEKYFSLNTNGGVGSIIEINKSGHFSISMSSSGGSFLTKRVKYLHELQNLCKAFDNIIVDVNWAMIEEQSEIESSVDEGEPMW